MVVITLFQIAGSLGLFLYGMKIMSDGIQKAAGERLHRILSYMTTNRFSGVLTGFVITSLIQSSSATTVMVVSFVNAGLLSLIQAIGVIMGANIGTTVTGWIVAILGFKIDITSLALPAIGLGLPIYFARKLERQEWGETLIGFGLLFLGLRFLKDAVPHIENNPDALRFLVGFTQRGLLTHLIFVVAGTLLTVIVQSSSAAMAITLTMAYSGWIDYPTAAAIILGENIGTTVTAYLASLSTNIRARQAARAHMIFNITGVIWISVVFSPFLWLVDLLVPGSVLTQSGITVHLAMFHTLFNVVNTLAFLGFVPHLAKLVERMVKAGEESGKYKLEYIATGIQDTPEINVLNAKRELSDMFSIIEDMYSMFLNVFHHPEKKMGKEVRRLKELEDYVDQMQVELSRYLAACARENLNEKSERNVRAMMRIVDELESISDSCFNLILLSQRRYEKKIKFSSKALQQINPYTAIVREFLTFNKKRLNNHIGEEDMLRAYSLERKINRYRDNLKKAAQKRIRKGSDVNAEILYIDMLSQIERIGDYSLNISQALRMTQLV